MVIPVHNAASTLGEQLDALTLQVAAPPFEVIVVLNRCTDHSERVAAGFHDRLDLHIITADRLGSAAHARNAGAAIAKGHVLLFCDADDRVDTNWVAAMSKVFDDDSVDICGSGVRVDRGERPDAVHRAVYAAYDQPLRLTDFDMLWCMSASMGCRLSAFERVGGFDETFPGAGYEELDLAFRIQRHGGRISPASGTTVHYRPRTGRRALLTLARSRAESEVRLRLKEGRLEPRSGILRIGKAVLRHSAALAIKRRELSPVVHVMGATRIIASARATNAVRRGTTIEVPPFADFTAPSSTPVIGGLAFRASRSTVGWWARRGVEQHTLEVVIRLIRPGDVLVDAGANIGIFSITAARCGARVVAFEPASTPRTALSSNALRHGVESAIEVSPVALSDREGTAEFINHENDLVAGFGEPDALFSPGAETGRETVAVQPLDTAFHDDLHLLKIDVEGWECAVLDGGAATLARNPSAVLIVEINPVTLERAGSSVQTLLDRLPRDRWDLVLIDERSAPHYRVVDVETLEFLHHAPARWYGNLLAVPMHRADEVRALLGLPARSAATP